jgi:predicted DNA-binding transcriptional regulator AlpA
MTEISSNGTSPVFTPAQLADVLGTSTTALAMHRSRGTGPAFSKLTARLIVYRREDVDLWIAANVRARTGEGETA